MQPDEKEANDDPIRRRLVSDRRALSHELASAHVDDATLALHAAGELPEAQALEVTKHLAVCEDGRCNEALRAHASGSGAAREQLFGGNQETDKSSDGENAPSAGSESGASDGAPASSADHTRTFQCREALWEAFERMAAEKGCSVDTLINDAMKEYAQHRSYAPGAPRPLAPRPEGGSLPRTRASASSQEIPAAVPRPDAGPAPAEMPSGPPRTIRGMPPAGTGGALGRSAGGDAPESPVAAGLPPPPPRTVPPPLPQPAPVSPLGRGPGGGPNPPAFAPSPAGFGQNQPGLTTSPYGAMPPQNPYAQPQHGYPMQPPGAPPGMQPPGGGYPQRTPMPPTFGGMPPDPRARPGYDPYAQPPPYGAPPMGQPPMGQPPMGQPPMGQPPMGQPPMGQPPMGQPPMGQPMGQPPMPGGAPPGYGYDPRMGYGAYPGQPPLGHHPEHMLTPGAQRAPTGGPMPPGAYPPNAPGGHGHPGGAFPPEAAAPMPQQGASPYGRPAHRPPLTVYYAGNAYPVDKDRFIIGRGKQSSDLVIKDPNVSRQHAMVEFLNGLYYVVDMGSTNGVEYRGERITRKAIGEGDAFNVCGHEIRFSYRTGY